MHPDLALPAELKRFVKSPKWPKGHNDVNWQEAAPLVDLDLIHRIDPRATCISFQPLPFYAVAELARGDKFFWWHEGRAQDLDTERCLIIGDFGMGSDSPIVLDYATATGDPRVIFLEWDCSPEPEQRTRWTEIATSFAGFCELLRLNEIDWESGR